MKMFNAESKKKKEIHVTLCALFVSPAHDSNQIKFSLNCKKKLVINPENKEIDL